MREEIASFGFCDAFAKLKVKGDVGGNLHRLLMSMMGGDPDKFLDASAWRSAPYLQNRPHCSAVWDLRCGQHWHASCICTLRSKRPPTAWTCSIPPQSHKDTKRRSRTTPKIKLKIKSRQQRSRLNPRKLLEACENLQVHVLKQGVLAQTIRTIPKSATIRLSKLIALVIESSGNDKAQNYRAGGQKPLRKGSGVGCAA